MKIGYSGKEKEQWHSYTDFDIYECLTIEDDSPLLGYRDMPWSCSNHALVLQQFISRTSYPTTFEVRGMTTDTDGDPCLMLSPEEEFPAGIPCAFEVDKAVAASVTSAMMQSAGCTETSGPTPTAIWPNITTRC